MSIIVALFGFLYHPGRIWANFPSSIISFVSRWQTQAGLYLAAIIRIVLGVASLFTASTSRAPLYLHILGVVAVVAGIATPFLVCTGLMR